MGTEEKTEEENAGGIYPPLPRALDKNRFTWSLAKGPSSSQIGYAEVKQTLERAFQVWEQVADVKFFEATIPPEEIKIRVEDDALWCNVPNLPWIQVGLQAGPG